MGTEAGVGADEVSGAGASVSVGTEEELGDEGMDVVDDGIASDAGDLFYYRTEDTDSGTIGEAEVTGEEAPFATSSPPRSFC